MKKVFAAALFAAGLGVGRSPCKFWNASALAQSNRGGIGGRQTLCAGRLQAVGQFSKSRNIVALTRSPRELLSKLSSHPSGGCLKTSQMDQS